MVLHEGPLSGALKTSYRDSWEMKKEPIFARFDEIKILQHIGYIILKLAASLEFLLLL